MLMINTANRIRFARKQQRGSTLLEVLISILLMSFGIMGLAGMQAYSVAAQRNAANRAVAAGLANELAELIRLNPGAAAAGGFAGGDYDIALMPRGSIPGETKCSYPACSTATALAKNDLTRANSGFLAMVTTQLPSGGVELSRPAGSTTEADLWIMWREPKVLNLTAGAESGSDNCPADAKALATVPRCFYMKVQL